MRAQPVLESGIVVVDWHGKQSQFDEDEWRFSLLLPLKLKIRAKAHGMNNSGSAYSIASTFVELFYFCFVSIRRAYELLGKLPNQGSIPAQNGQWSSSPPHSISDEAEIGKKPKGNTAKCDFLYQKTETREQGKVTVNGNPTSAGVRDGIGETVPTGTYESHTAHDRV